MDLVARIEAELRERLEAAVDFVCLGALVERRRARGLPPLDSDSTRDRAEYEASVAWDLAPEQAARVEAAGRAAADEPTRLVAVQVALARALPDYWERFEAGRASFSVDAAPASGGERRGRLGRLFRRR